MTATRPTKGWEIPAVNDEEPEPYVSRPFDDEIDPIATYGGCGQ